MNVIDFSHSLRPSLRIGFLARIFAALTLCLVSTASQSASIAVVADPGEEGTLCCPGALIALKGDEFGDELWVVFDDMKHIEAVQWGFKFTSSAPYVDDNGDEVEWSFSLTDMFGNAIPDRIREREGTGQGQRTNTFAFPVIAHGIRLMFNGDYDFGIEVEVNGVVGTWVPEPSSFFLAALGLTIVSLTCLRAPQNEIGRKRETGSAHSDPGFPTAERVALNARSASALASFETPTT